MARINLRLCRFLLLVSALFIAWSCYGAAVTEEYLDSIYRMNEVVVVENRRQEVIPSQRLDGVELEKLNSQSVADALRYFSGVQIKDFGGVGGMKTVNVRSMGSQNVGVYYDGLQLGNAQNGQVDLGRYSLDNIEEISVYNGQKSNILQGAKDFGTAGVIYMRSRRPHWRGSEHTHVMAQMRCGSFGLANPEVVWDQRLSHTLSMTASAGYTYSNGKYKFTYRRRNADNSLAYDTTATRQNSDISAFRGEVSVFGFSERGSWNGKVYYYDSERGIPGAIVNNVLRNGERQLDRNFFAQAGGEWLINPRYHLKVSAKWAWDYTRFLRNDIHLLNVDNHYYQQELYVSACQMVRVNDWWRVSLSTDFQWNKMNADLVDFLYPVRFTEMVAVATSVSFSRFDAQASLLGTFIQDRAGGILRYPRETVDRNQMTPSMFFSWQPLAGVAAWRINGFYKRAFRMPTFNDLYYTDVGNKYLKPETTTQYDVGMTYNFIFRGPIVRTLSFRADGYYNRVSDKIVAYPSGQQFRWTMLNLGKVNIYGFEASAASSMEFGNLECDLRANYTYQKAIDVTNPNDSYYKNQIPYIPRHAFTGAISAGWKGWNLNYSYIYTGQRYNAQENIATNYEPAWTTSDISLFKNFAVGKTGWRTGLEVNNLFGQNYEIVHCYPMPGRSFKIILKLTI